MIPSPRNDDCLTEISRAAKTLAFLTSRYYARTKSSKILFYHFTTIPRNKSKQKKRRKNKSDKM